MKSNLSSLDFGGLLKLKEGKIYGLHKSHVCKREALSGLGFRELESFNTTLFAKQVWHILNEPSSLLARLLQAKYNLGGNILSA